MVDGPEPLATPVGGGYGQSADRPICIHPGVLGGMAHVSGHDVELGDVRVCNGLADVLSELDGFPGDICFGETGVGEYCQPREHRSRCCSS